MTFILKQYGTPQRLELSTKTDLVVIGGMGQEGDKHVKEAIAEVQPEEDELKSGCTCACSSLNPVGTPGPHTGLASTG